MFGDVSILILAVIAALLVFRLYKVLGKRSGHEHQSDPFTGVANDDGRRDTVVPLPERRPSRPEDSGRPAPPDSEAADTGGALAAGIRQIREADPAFDVGVFLAGARKAFEMVVAAFAAGDAATLRPLLNDEVFANFTGAMKARQSDGHVLETTLVGMKSTELIEAGVQGRHAGVTVKFVSEQINVVRDAAGNVVEGDPATVTVVTDLWTFSRNTRSRDPNWMLVATQSPN